LPIEQKESKYYLQGSRLACEITTHIERGVKMSKFLNLWEVDSSKMPTDPNERAALVGKLIEMTKKMLDEGQVTDWGIFAGGGAGYAIAGGTEADAYKRTLPFAPYIKFQVHPVLSIDEMAEAIKSIRG
jgi:hypothetical protein